jgi:negative regulator of sigma-B (phosphoserine phosphatase)
VILRACHRNRPRRGEIRSGDAALIRSANGTSLLALVDVLGHGDHAADVAEQATEFLQTAPVEESVRALLEGLHQTLRSSRGAAATLCLVRQRSFEAAGIGNVSLHVFGSPISVVPTPGILGLRLRDLRVTSGVLEARTRLVLHSDGVRATFAEAELRGSPKEACFSILNGYARDDDDATVLIADVA